MAFEGYMPLLRELLASEFDEPTQVMLAAVYLEACREIDTATIDPALLEKLRAEVSERILRLARSGERNPNFLKREALKDLRPPRSTKGRKGSGARVLRELRRGWLNMFKDRRRLR